MEFSSPLAAMQAPSHPTGWGCRRDLPSTRSTISGAHNFGSSRFNINELSMKRANNDYFTLNPVRGSSPTASLAADLSSNFHIDQSPQFATPRRSLFTSNMFQPLDPQAEGTTPPPFRWEGGTTPPIPSSSPYFGIDSMDISPLPHKVPFSIITHPVESPTPEPTHKDDDMLSPCSIPDLPLLDLPRPVSVQERKKPFILRPSLARCKNLSTNTVTVRQKENIPLPPFSFGNTASEFSKPSGSVLDECFSESPPQDRKAFHSALAPLPRARPFNLILHASRSSGSPCGGPIRKPAGPPSKRPSKFRRSLSMFEHPGDIMRQSKDEYKPSTLQSVMDVDDSPKLNLPHFTPPDEPDGLPRINASTLVDVLNGAYDGHFEKKMVVDCRFEYEYDGGHVDGAVNFCEKEQLADELFSMSRSTNTLLIFHCEYSAHRAPLMAKFVRQKDRTVNLDRYPQLSYPEVYILDGGYSAFFTTHRNRCFPQSYLKMDSKEHEHACERGMNKLRHRTKLNRAQTFAFGSDYSQMEDSPTNQGRSRPGLVPTLSTVSDDFSLNSGRFGTRRLASY